MLASLVSSASPSPPLMPPVTARLMWHATPLTLGSSKPSTAILSLGPSQRKLVLTSPVVPRLGRSHSHTAKISTSKSTHAPAIEATRRMSTPVGSQERDDCTTLGDRQYLIRPSANFPGADTVFVAIR